MKRILQVVAMVAAFAAIGAVPTMARQVAPAQSAQAVQAVRHQIPFITCSPCHLFDANGSFVVVTASGSQFSVLGTIGALFQQPLLGTVHSGWPFSDGRFDSLYAGDQVLQFAQTNGGLGCMQTDSVHSGVVDNPCGSHNAGT